MIYCVDCTFVDCWPPFIRFRAFCSLSRLLILGQFVLIREFLGFQRDITQGFVVGLFVVLREFGIKMAEALKQARRSAKRNATMALNKMKALFLADCEDVLLETQIQIVEKTYEEVYCCHLDYIEENGDEGDDTYMTETTSDYYKAVEQFNQLQKDRKDKALQREILIKKQSVERGFFKLKGTISRVHAELKGECRASVLQEDKLNLEFNLQVCIEEVTQLSALGDDVSSLNDDVSSSSLVCENLIRDINVILKENTLKLESKSNNVAAFEMGRKVDPDKSDVVGGLANGSVHTPEMHSGSNHFFPNSVGGPADESKVNVCGTSVSGGLSGGILTFSGSPSVTSGIPGSMYTSRMQPMSGGILSEHPGSTYMSRIQSVPGGITSVLPGSVYTSGMQSLTSAIPSVFPCSPVYTPGTQAGGITFSGGNHVVGSSSMYTSGSQVGSAPVSGLGTLGSRVEHEPDTIRAKRTPLPVFSGSREDWPEFKCLWQSIAERQINNKMQLAMELKRSCSKGRASERLKHILVTSEVAYSDMWNRLVEEYDDVGLNVQSILNRLVSLRVVEEKKPSMLVQFVDCVEGVYIQLKELQHLEAVHMSEVDRLSSLLPKEIQLNWLRHARAMPGNERMRPFGAFINFLKIERAVATHMTEVAPSVKKPQCTLAHGADAADVENNRHGVLKRGI